MKPHKEIIVGVVGPCGSGKSTLVKGLQQNGFQCHHIAQEHSYVEDMWLRLVHPDILIFLEASYSVCTSRRQLNWTQEEYQEQLHRLDHAHRNASMIIQTDNLSSAEILNQVLVQLSIK